MLFEVREYDFVSVCVNLIWVEYVKKGFEGIDVKVCIVVGFFLGVIILVVKLFEIKEVI